MKQFFLAAILAAALGVAHAQNVSSTSFAATGSKSVSGVIGNGAGYSSQQSGATAWNSTAATSSYTPYAGSPTVGADGTVNTGAASAGGTTSFVKGVNWGSAFGASGAIGVQQGSASAVNGGAYASLTGVHVYGAASEASVKSASGSANINNGFAANGTTTSAENASVGFSKQTGWFGNSTGGSSVGGTSNLSGGVAWGAIGATGGTASQGGLGGGF